MKASPVPLWNTEKVEFLPNGSLSRGPQISRSFEMLGSSLYRGDLWKQPFAKECVRRHASAGCFPGALDSEESYQQPTWSLIRPIIRVVALSDSLDIETKQLLSVYWTFRDAWTRKRAVSDVTVPILNVKGAASIRLGALEFSPFSYQQKNTLVNAFLHQDLMSLGTIARSTYVLSTRLVDSQD